MFATLAFAACLVGPKSATFPDASVDLFLVAGGVQPLSQLSGGEEPKNEVERQLQAITKAHDESRTRFVLLDGGDVSRILGASKNSAIQCAKREYWNSDSETDQQGVNGAQPSPHNHHVHSESTVWSRLPIKRLQDFDFSTPFAYMRAGIGPEFGPTVAIQDLNSYLHGYSSGDSISRGFIDHTILLSAESLANTQRLLHDRGVNFTGVCICANGSTEKLAPNFVAFPPPGVVAHYKLNQHNGLCEINLIENLGTPNP